MQSLGEHIVGKHTALRAEQAKILVVDDNENFLAVITELLQHTGYEVLSALTSQTALDILHQSPPDMIIADVMMPGIDGHEFYDIVIQTPEWSDIPFLFLTGLSDPAAIRRGKERGCDDYLTKPFIPEELLAIIRGKLTAARRRKTLSEEKMEIYRRRIIHTLSHEFRTPLVAINTGTELLLDHNIQLEADRVRHLLESVYRGGQRLQRLVNDFMTLQHIDSGRATSTHKEHCRVFSLRAITETAIEYFVTETNANVQLSAAETSSAADWNVSVYDIHIVEAIQRLLSNALKFGGEEKAIFVSVASEGDFVSVHVRDRGPGLPAELFDKAVETFAQINREKLEQQGCGLGLTIASYFTEINGGSLGFLNPEDGGVEAIVRFPRVKELQEIPVGRDFR